MITENMVDDITVAFVLVGMSWAIAFAIWAYQKYKNKKD